MPILTSMRNRLLILVLGVALGTLMRYVLPPVSPPNRNPGRSVEDRQGDDRPTRGAKPESGASAMRASDSPDAAED